ncbi:amino acid adenylation domain-containing protein [Lachnospiraceae bacterium C1.1]|nr:amino acid adenylation domain-containing protein [Lachnospiraceae bacterium C1.1]
MRNFNKNVLEWLEEAAEAYPDRVVYEDENEKITFAELRNEAKRVGSGIIRENLPEGPVAVMMERSVHTIAVFLGVVYAGRAYAPIEAKDPLSRRERILSTLGNPALITDDRDLLIENCRTLNSSVLIKNEIDENAIKNVKDRLTENDPLYIIFTSGSSGNPKGVITSHRSLICYINSYRDVMGIDETDVLASQSQLDYIAAIRDIYLPLLTGARTFLLPKEYFMQPDVLFDSMNRHGVTAAGWSSSAVTVITKLGAFKDCELKGFKKLCFSGSVMPGKVLALWQENLPECRFVNQYGPTEATASCTYYVVDHKVSEDEVLPIGKAYDDYRVFLLSENGKAVPQGEYGEICVSGPCVTLGYYNDAERTAAAFVQNPLNSAYREIIYKTGDIGRFREDGELEFHGRSDRQIKHMGHRVELDEIEAAAMEIKGVSECAALYDSKKENLWLLYTGETASREIAVQLKGMLPLFMVPRKIKQLESLAKLPNGKTDIKTLEKETFGGIRK